MSNTQMPCENTDNEKLHWFLVSYHWQSKTQQGHGHRVLHGKEKRNRMADINTAVESVSDNICSKYGFSKETISVVILNINYLDYCSTADFYEK